MKKKNIDVTISLVNYKTPELLIACIDSIYKYTKKITFEIIVADNNSQDNGIKLLKQKYPSIKVFENKTNLYATGGNNQVFQVAKGEFFMVLNPDIEFVDNAIYKMYTYLQENQKVAAVSCFQYRKNGKAEPTGSHFSTPLLEFMETNMMGRFFRNEEKIAWYRYAGWNRKTNKVVDVIPDTIMLIRTDVARKLELYDENIKLFFMENDLCKRIQKLGYKVCHLGTVRVVHLRGESTKTLPSKALYKIYQKDMLYYYGKYFGPFWKAFLFATFQINSLYYFLEPVILKARNTKVKDRWEDFK